MIKTSLSSPSTWASYMPRMHLRWCGTSSSAVGQIEFHLQTVVVGYRLRLSVQLASSFQHVQKEKSYRYKRCTSAKEKGKEKEKQERSNHGRSRRSGIALARKARCGARPTESNSTIQYTGLPRSIAIPPLRQRTSTAHPERESRTATPPAAVSIERSVRPRGPHPPGRPHA